MNLGMSIACNNPSNRVPANSWIGALVLSAWVACGPAHGQTSVQCCTSISPELPPATAYGSTISRSDDPRAGYKPYIPMPIDAATPADMLYQRIGVEELRLGPYSPALVDDFQELGAALFQSQEYFDAIDAFGRAIHLLRINEGLHTMSQTGLVEQVIEAHIGVGDFVAADDQQDYLHRVRRSTLPATGPEMLEAVEQYADWHRAAYIGQLDKYRYPRIVSLIDLYGDMAKTIADERGELSRDMLPYLEGKLKTEYLLSNYPGESEEGLQFELRQKDDIELPDLTKMRFERFQMGNYRYGHQTIQQMRNILENDPNTTPAELADIQVAMADWYQWHRRYAQAIRAYNQAWQMMAGEPDAASWTQATFEDPIELPVPIVFQPGRIPLRTNNEARVVARFEISRHGEAKKIEILYPHEKEDQPAITRGYKYLRDMRFRPRFENGEAVAAKDIERTYNIHY